LLAFDAKYLNLENYVFDAKYSNLENYALDAKYSILENYARGLPINKIASTLCIYTIFTDDFAVCVGKQRVLSRPSNLTSVSFLRVRPKAVWWTLKYPVAVKSFRNLDLGTYCTLPSKILYNPNTVYSLKPLAASTMTLQHHSGLPIPAIGRWAYQAKEEEQIKVVLFVIIK
jgi:hypothetical protein